MRALVALVVVVTMGCAVLGIGMGQSPAEREPAPPAAAVAAAKQRIASGGASVRRGAELFADEGCERCHAIAAIGAEGALGPRLDTLDADLDDNLESIEEPRKDITDGYPDNLMPADYGTRLSDAERQALAAFVTTVSGGKREDAGGRGRGRGRGRSGED